MYSTATIVQHHSASYYPLFNQKLILLERRKIVSLFFYHSTSLVILKRGLEISIIMFPCLSVGDPVSTTLSDVTRAPLMRVNKSDFVLSAVRRNLDPESRARTQQFWDNSKKNLSDGALVVHFAMKYVIKRFGLSRTFKLMSILGKSFGKNLLQQVRSS